MTDVAAKPLLIYQVLDDVIQAVAAPERAAEVKNARRQWAERRGRLFEDEHLWEAWTSAFLEWFALERDSNPLAAALLAAETDPERAGALRAWLSSLRTAVEVLAIGGGKLEVQDLLGGARFSVTEKRALAGVAKGDVAEVRLIGFGDSVRLGRTFWFHPTGTRKAIVARIAEMRSAGREREGILDHLARLRVRCERYAHLPPSKIYASSDDRIPERERG